MGHDNKYTDYSKINKHVDHTAGLSKVISTSKEENETEIIDETVIDVTNMAATTLHNEENQNTVKSITENIDKAVATNEENQIIENSVTESTNVIGIIVDCDLLNIRQRPEADAHILGTIKKDEEIQVEKDATDPDNRFYKIVTASGVHGYCMKQFIELRGE